MLPGHPTLLILDDMYDERDRGQTDFQMLVVLRVVPRNKTRSILICREFFPMAFATVWYAHNRAKAFNMGS